MTNLKEEDYRSMILGNLYGDVNSSRRVDGVTDGRTDRVSALYTCDRILEINHLGAFAT